MENWLKSSRLLIFELIFLTKFTIVCSLQVSFVTSLGYLDFLYKIRSTLSVVCVVDLFDFQYPNNSIVCIRVSSVSIILCFEMYCLLLVFRIHRPFYFV